MNKLNFGGALATAKPTLPQRFVRSLPKSWQPYARLSRMDKPIGTWLLYSPCTWSLTMAATAAHAPIGTYAYYMALFGVGAVLTRSAGCTVNDLWDRKMDAKVERTVDRPLAAGEVTVPKAVAWLGVQGVASLGVLAMLPNATCWWLGAASVIPVLVYPAFKRFTYYPQYWLSIWFSWGTVMGFPAMGVTNWPAAVSLLASATTWSIIYDTIYGHQDKKDDIKVGVKSTALKWGGNTRPIINRLWYVQFATLAASGVFAGMGPGFFVGGAAAAWRMRRMMNRVDLDTPASCGQFFLDNIKNGHLITLGAFIDYIASLFI